MSTLELLAVHAIENLPDSVSARRELLTAVLDQLPRMNPLSQHARLMLRLLDEHNRAQRELPLEFKRTT